MQSIRPETPIPFRCGIAAPVGTIMLRFVGLLVAAIAVMALIWSR